MNRSESEHVTANPNSSGKKVRKVNSGSSMIKTLRRKVSMGARTVRGGGCMTHRVFKQVYVEEERQKNFKCSLSTTTGPIAGRLIISTEELAFCSDKEIKFSTATRGDFIYARYKVMIPLVKIERVTKSDDVEKHTDKYMLIVTVDRCEFWFMRIANYQNTIKYVQQALPKRIGSADTSSLE